jgi:thiamine biosynthesis protein ThiS
MKIFVNGERVDCGGACTVANFLQRHQASPETTLVELNGAALRRSEWEEQMLQENDRVEILRVAAGG